MKKENVKSFLEKIREEEVLVSGCKKFHEMEPRDIAYVISREIITRKEDNINHILTGAKIMIITWNANRFRVRPKKIKIRLESDIIDAYSACKSDLEILQDMKLEKLDFNKFKEIIGNVFTIFSSKPSIEYTGASKILHTINPHIFMMWDTSIRNAYHELHTDRNHTIAKCYVEFQIQSQKIIREILKKTTKKKLWEEHLTFVDKDFVQEFSFHETILKMLDECNYVRFKLNQDF